MKKVLGIIGSPRRQGNTHLLVSKILEGARAAGAETEEILLGEMNVRECIGCHACWSGKPCSRDDDMNGLYPKIAGAGAFIFGTPVYWYGPTALMKCFIDRFVYFNCTENRENIRGKSAVLAVPFEEENPETAELLTIFFEISFSYLEINLIGSVIIPGMARKGQIWESPGHLTKAYELGRSLAIFEEIGTEEV